MPTTSPNDRVRVVARVSGRVQMVGFRWWTHQRARELGIGGSVVNLPDGRVEVCAEGARASVDMLVADLRTGPASARVDDVALEWQPPVGERGFRVG